VICKYLVNLILLSLPAVVVAVMVAEVVVATLLLVILEEMPEAVGITARKRKMKGEVVLVDSPLWEKKIKSKTKYFKKGFFGWHRRRSDLVAALDGKFDT